MIGTYSYAVSGFSWLPRLLISKHGKRTLTDVFEILLAASASRRPNCEKATPKVIVKITETVAWIPPRRGWTMPLELMVIGELIAG